MSASFPEHPTRQRSAISRALHRYPILQPSKHEAGFTTPVYPVVKPVLINLFLTCLSETKVKSLLSGTLLQGKSNPESHFLTSCKFRTVWRRRTAAAPSSRKPPLPPKALPCLRQGPWRARQQTPREGASSSPPCVTRACPRRCPEGRAPRHVLRPRAGLAGGPDGSHVQHQLAQVEPAIRSWIDKGVGGNTG